MAALAVAVLLVWSASTGPANLTEGLPHQPVVSDTPTHADGSGASHGARRTSEDTGHAQASGSRFQWLDDAFGLAVVLAGLWVLGAVVRGLLNVVVARLPEKQLVVDLDPRPDVAAGREAVTRERDRMREALASSDVRNGIVACWVLLEEAAETAGVAPRPTETPTEFVVRFLHALDVDPRPVARLTDLYREARFSTHPMGEQERARAESALAAVHEELARAGAPA